MWYLIDKLISFQVESRERKIAFMLSDPHAYDVLQSIYLRINCLMFSEKANAL
jgi:hypothetical protein